MPPQSRVGVGKAAPRVPRPKQYVLDRSLLGELAQATARQTHQHDIIRSNVECCHDIAIARLVNAARETTGCAGRIALDAPRPNGTARKL